MTISTQVVDFMVRHSMTMGYDETFRHKNRGPLYIGPYDDGL